MKAQRVESRALIEALAAAPPGEESYEGELRLGGADGPGTVVGVEALSVPGDRSRPNEDAFGIVKAGGVLFAAVFDGTTSVQPIELLEQRGITGAAFAAQLLKRALAAVATGEISARDVLVELNSALYQTCTGIDGIDQRDVNSLPASSATVVKVDPGKRAIELAHVYDSWCIVVEADGRPELATVDRNSGFDREILDLMSAIAAREGITPREARNAEEVRRAIERSRIVKTNAPGGSGVGLVNGDPKMVPYIQTASFPLPGVRAVLLGTDGLVPLGWSVQREDDRRKILDEIRIGGLRRLMALKVRREDADPSWSVPRFKHSDDATGVFLEFRDSGAV